MTCDMAYDDSTHGECLIDVAPKHRGHHLHHVLLYDSSHHTRLHKIAQHEQVWIQSAEGTIYTTCSSDVTCSALHTDGITLSTAELHRAAHTHTYGLHMDIHTVCVEC